MGLALGQFLWWRQCVLVLLCLLATVHVEVNAAVLVEVGNGGLGHGLGWRVRQGCDTT